MILLTTAEKRKIAIKINHITSIHENGDKTQMKIKGIDEKIVVLESIDEIKSFLRDAGKKVVGGSNKNIAELLTIPKV